MSSLDAFHLFWSVTFCIALPGLRAPVPHQPSPLQKHAGALGVSSYQQTFGLAKHTGLSGFAAESLAPI